MEQWMRQKTSVSIMSTMVEEVIGYHGGIEGYSFQCSRQWKRKIVQRKQCQDLVLKDQPQLSKLKQARKVCFKHHKEKSNWQVQQIIGSFSPKEHVVPYCVDLAIGSSGTLTYTSVHQLCIIFGVSPVESPFQNWTSIMNYFHLSHCQNF